MKRKVKMSFEALEKELSKVNSNEMLSLLGGGDPLPNGNCIFNMVAYMLDGNTNDAQCYKDELTSRYTFTPGTTNAGLPGYSYDPDNVASYMGSYKNGYTVSYGESPNSSDIKSVLNMGGKVGVSYNGHNYVAKDVNMSNGKVKLYDPTNPSNPDVWVDPSSMSGVYNFYQNSTTEHYTTPSPEPYTTPSPDPMITTEY